MPEDQRFISLFFSMMSNLPFSAHTDIGDIYPKLALNLTNIYQAPNVVNFRLHQS